MFSMHGMSRMNAPKIRSVKIKIKTGHMRRLNAAT